MLLRTTALLLLLASAGCTSWKLSPASAPRVYPTSPVPASAAKICVVRTAVIGFAVTFPTRDNGALVGATRGETYFCYLAEPGLHEITIEADEVEHAALSAEAGKSYFLKQEVDNIFGYVKCRAVWVGDAAAIGLFDAADHKVLTGVPGAERLPADPPFAPAKKASSSPSS